MAEVVWRDSVAMGDDMDAPHEWAVAIPPEAPIRSLVSKILERKYLATIGGGRATWIVEGKRPVAVLAQQWRDARWLVEADSPIMTLRREGGRPDFKIRYWCQIDPEEVYACLLEGRTLPDRYSR
jgi:hypothetical protein